MKMEFTVKRNRGSVTQGTATVLLNGQEVITFADDITITDDNRRRVWRYNRRVAIKQTRLGIYQRRFIPLFHKCGNYQKAHYGNYRINKK